MPLWVAILISTSIIVIVYKKIIQDFYLKSDERKLRLGREFLLLRHGPILRRCVPLLVKDLKTYVLLLQTGATLLAMFGIPIAIGLMVLVADLSPRNVAICCLMLFHNFLMYAAAVALCGLPVVINRIRKKVLLPVMCGDGGSNADH